jgi:beta-phosphoglucomutase-like phosphatase (HAD superfamily)
VEAALLDAIGRADTTFWDFDGVLADTEPLQLLAYRRILADGGHTLDDEVFAALIGRKEADIWERLWEQGIGTPTALEPLAERRADLFLALCDEHGLRPPERVRQLVAAAGGERILLSSGRARVIHALLERWGLEREFSAVHALADEPDPKAAVLARLVEERRAGAAGWHGAIVEDSPAMLAEAAALGLVTVAVAHGMNDHAALGRADFVLPATLEA